MISKITFWLSSLKLENSLALAIVRFPFSSISFNSGISLLFILSYLLTCVGDSFKSLAIRFLTFPGIFSPLAFLALYSSVSLFTCSSFSKSVNSLVWALAWIKIISASRSLASMTLQGTKANNSFPCSTNCVSALYLLSPLINSYSPLSNFLTTKLWFNPFILISSASSSTLTIS